MRYMAYIAITYRSFMPYKAFVVVFRQEWHLLKNRHYLVAALVEFINTLISNLEEIFSSLFNRE